eukprot:296474-Amphidinium_carterae.1
MVEATAIPAQLVKGILQRTASHFSTSSKSSSKEVAARQNKTTGVLSVSYPVPFAPSWQVWPPLPYHNMSSFTAKMYHATKHDCARALDYKLDV